jgi:hypothetical protein
LTLTLAAGVSTATITVTPVDDTAVEGAESVTLTAKPGTAYVLGSATSATASIADNDLPSLSIANASVTEGNSGTKTVTVTLTLSAASPATVTVAYATGGGTATAGVDYVATSGTLTFAAGIRTQSFTVTIKGDTLKESNETILVTLSNAKNATIGSATGTITIVDDEKALTATSAGPTTAGASTLGAADVTAALAAARAVWASAGVDTSLLEGVTVTVADLPDTMLGETEGTLITLDLDAAGWSWGAGGMDLVTVLVHELGHVLGLEHDDAGAMAATLRAGERLAPAPVAGTAAPVVRAVLSSAAFRPPTISARGPWAPTRLQATAKRHAAPPARRR